MSTNASRQLRELRFLPRLLATAGVFRLPLKPIFNQKIRNDMRHSLRIFSLSLMLSAAVVAQTPSVGTTAKPSSPAKTHAAATASKPPANSATGLPTEDEVNGFMQAQLGWDPQATWKIISIKPSKAEGLAEVNVQM